jgi:hypothetical protein
LKPLLERMRTDSVNGFRPQVEGNPLTNLTPEAKQALRAHLVGVNADMADVKMGALRWGMSRRDMALLDYTKRTGADNFFQVLFPYQFWMTRSMMNWGARTMANPAILANF